MKERPILFSGPMVRAILEGRKTQTRRVVKPQPEPIPADVWRAKNSPGVWWPARLATSMVEPREMPMFCPYGAPGDRLWARETWQPLWKEADVPGNWETGEGFYVNYPATDGVEEWRHEDDGLVTRCRPSIHMPRWASRITLEVTDVRVERLQEISLDDCEAEGIQFPPRARSVGNFAALWESINGEGSWKQNPWVWCVSFKRIEADAKRGAA